MQNPIVLGEHSEPEPDLALLRRRDDFCTTATARAEDVLLVIEVADSTLAYDRDVKLPLYARHGARRSQAAEDALSSPSSGAANSERMSSAVSPARAPRSASRSTVCWARSRFRSCMAMIFSSTVSLATSL